MTTNESSALKQLKKWFKTNRKKLAQAGVAAIEGEYSGSGDSGQCDGVSVCMADERSERYHLPREINDLITEAVEEVSGVTGYENGDGGGGKILLYVKTGEIVHQSYTYVLETQANEDETL